MPTAILLSQGDEVLTGQTVDTNAAWLAAKLTGLGFVVLQHVTVGDSLEAIRLQVENASKGADLVLSTGGLGPTEDDLTAQAVGVVFNRTLELDEIALKAIEKYYRDANRHMPGVNRKQAYLPVGSHRIDNPWGTAPGFAVTDNDCLSIFMPGVPREMKQMFQQMVRPLLNERFQLMPARLVTLRTTGVGESTLQERIGSFTHADIVLSYRTMLPENHIKLRIQPNVSDDVVNGIVQDLAGKIGSPVFAIEGLTGRFGGSLEEVVGRALLERDESVAVAESCTGGQICALFTSIPGSSGWFSEGAITYSNAAKIRQIGVKATTLEKHGAVSQQVCEEMARGIRETAGTTYGLSTTGVAGPGGGSADKPVGTVHIGLQTPTSFFTHRLRLSGDRSRIQKLSTAACIDMLRRHLQHFHLEMR